MGAVAASAGLADLISQASGSPVAAGLLGATAATIDIVVGKANDRRREKVAATAVIGAEQAGTTVEVLVANLLEDDSKLELLAAAFEGAARAIDQRKLVILGRSLASGYGSSDSAKLDQEVYMARLISDLERPHLRILQYLEKDPQREGHLRLARRLDLLSLQEPQVLGYSLLATLLRHALIEGISRAQFERSFPKETRRRLRVSEHNSEPVAYLITTLGSYVLDRYREAGNR